MKFRYSFTLLFLICIVAFAKGQALKSGPMLAYSTMKEVLIWIQTSEDAEVQIRYHLEDSLQAAHWTATVATNASNDRIAHLLANELEPGNRYVYEVYINGKKEETSFPCVFQTQNIWKWRGDAPDFSFATGSCTYINESKYDRPGKPYGHSYKIFESIDSLNPDFFLWLGDNVYLRESDWNSRTGIRHRYAHTRAVKEMAPLLARTHSYAIWDDHDYGPNNSDRSYPMKNVTLSAFRDYFPSPSYIFEDGTTSFMQWADCEFFLLDNRSWRSPNRRSDIDSGTILGEKQREWLIDALVNSSASFKFIAMGGQFLSVADYGERYIHVAEKERSWILNKLEEMKVEGVIFLSGDVHYTEMSILERDDAYPLHELTISPLTSGSRKRDVSSNTLHVPETVVQTQNFARINISGPLSDRKLEIQVYDNQGHMLWTHSISAGLLKYPE